MTEEWLAVEGYEGHYEVSSSGRVRSMEREVVDARGYKRTWPAMILKQKTTANGYKSVVLQSKGVRKHAFVHRLVAKAFVWNLQSKPTVNHKDFDTANNRYDNLEWASQAEQVQHSAEAGHQCSSTNKNKYKVMTDAKLERLVTLRNTGMTTEAIAKELDVSPSLVVQICKGTALKGHGVADKLTYQRRAVLSDMDVVDIRKACVEGSTAKELSVKYGTTLSCIYGIKNNKRRTNATHQSV